MSEHLRNFTKAAYTLQSVANRVPADAWDQPSCCTEWTAREVAGHASWVLQNIAATAGQTEGPGQAPEADVAGDDPAATVRSSVAAAVAALDQPGVLRRVGPTPFGEMPIDSFLGTVWVDPLTHAWDIADAAGIDAGIDDETADAAASTIEPVKAMLQGVGAMAPSLETDSESSLDRFIALVGRQSVR